MEANNNEVDQVIGVFDQRRQELEAMELRLIEETALHLHFKKKYDALMVVAIALDVADRVHHLPRMVSKLKLDLSLSQSSARGWENQADTYCKMVVDRDAIIRDLQAQLEQRPA